jgi:hypothetical protein
MRTILTFIFAAWIVIPTVSCAQLGKDSTSPGQLAPGVSQKAVLEASLGTPPPVGWKWLISPVRLINSDLIWCQHNSLSQMRP